MWKAKGPSNFVTHTAIWRTPLESTGWRTITRGTSHFVVFFFEKKIRKFSLSCGGEFGITEEENVGFLLCSSSKSQLLGKDHNWAWFMPAVLLLVNGENQTKKIRFKCPSKYCPNGFSAKHCVIIQLLIRPPSYVYVVKMDHLVIHKECSVCLTEPPLLVPNHSPENKKVLPPFHWRVPFFINILVNHVNALHLMLKVRKIWLPIPVLLPPKMENEFEPRELLQEWSRRNKRFLVIWSCLIRKPNAPAYEMVPLTMKRGRI